MKKGLKYIISILLIFSLTINEYTSYLQYNTSSHFQTTQIVRNKRIADLKVYYFAKGHFLKKVFVLFLQSFQTLLNHFKKQVKTTLKLQALVVLGINNPISDYLFLNKSKLHSTKIYSSLYIG